MKIEQEDFIIYEHNGQHHLAIGENYKYSATAILTHIMRLPDVEVLAKKSWVFTDDYQAEFAFKNHVFVLSTSWDCVDINPLNPKISDEVSLELYEYIETYSGISIFYRLGALLKCLFLPFSYKP